MATDRIKRAAAILGRAGGLAGRGIPKRSTVTTAQARARALAGWKTRRATISASVPGGKRPCNKTK